MMLLGRFTRVYIYIDFDPSSGEENQDDAILTYRVFIFSSKITLDTFDMRINAHFSYPSPDKSSLQPLTGYDYHEGYRIKIKLICRYPR